MKLFEDFPPISTREWEEKIIKDLKGADYEKKLIWRTQEGFVIKPYYRSEDIINIPFKDSLPGEFPFIRGYKNNNAWDVREDIENSNPEAANALAIKAIKNGATALGLNAKEISSTEDIAKLLKGIKPEKTAIHFIGADSYLKLADIFIKYIGIQGLDPEKIKGSFNFDPLGYFVLHGKFYANKEKDMDEGLQLYKLYAKKLPSFRLISVNAQLFHNAGGYMVQVIPYSLSLANEYLVYFTDNGIPVDDISSRMQFIYAISSNYFMEISKIRAVRVLWSGIVNQYQPKKKENSRMFIHACSSYWNKTLYDPYVNMLRNTTEAMSAIIGGVDSLNLLPFDSTYKTPDEFSRRNARNTQSMLKEESYLDKVKDPSAGSYYLESLTESLADSAWKKFQEVEEAGGFIEYFLSGKVKQEVEEIVAQRSKDLATRKQSILGTNQYPNTNEMMLEKITKDESGSFNGLQQYRGSGIYEELRLQTEKHIQAGGYRPLVLLVPMGNLAMRRARATFTANFYAIAGYEIQESKPYVPENAAILMDEIKQKNPQIICFCSSDEEYIELLPALIKNIKINGHYHFIVAGNPRETLEGLKMAGVDDFIHLRTNALDFLKETQKQLGIH